MATNAEYLALITSAFRDKPKFSAMIEADVSLLVRVQNLLLEILASKFDVDLAVGEQLDTIGEWVGISRNVNIPITGIYFSWDAEQTVGWEFGVWEGVNAAASITELPDDVYRTLIKAKIAANSWDGTTTGAYRVWDALFPNITILIQDNQNMSYELAFVGGIVDSLTFALIADGYIPLKPEGVRVNTYFVPVDDGPLFGWDLDSENIKGWEDGSWAREISP